MLLRFMPRADPWQGLLHLSKASGVPPATLTTPNAKSSRSGLGFLREPPGINLSASGLTVLIAGIEKHHLVIQPHVPDLAGDALLMKFGRYQNG